VQVKNCGQRRKIVTDCFGELRIRAAVGRRPLYVKTCHWRAKVLIDRMTGPGRLREFEFQQS
jgi:CRISPR/Cas system CSM-associated protein Csm3 (group 7 of RAMP superfamily)